MIKNLKQLSLVFLACVALFSCGDNDDSGEKEQKEKFYTAKDVQPAQMEGSSASAGTHSTEYRWSDYIALHSQGYVSRKSNINIAFFSPVVDANTVGHSARDFIEIKPAIDGEIVFISPREIEIQPSRSLPSAPNSRASTLPRIPLARRQERPILPLRSISQTGPSFLGACSFSRAAGAPLHGVLLVPCGVLVCERKKKGEHSRRQGFKSTQQHCYDAMDSPDQTKA